MIDEDVEVRDNSGLSNLPPSLETTREYRYQRYTRYWQVTGDPWSEH